MRALSASLRCLVCLGLAGAVACEDAPVTPAADADIPAHSLVILGNQEVSLAPGQSAELRVKYVTAQGSPLQGNPIAVEILVNPAIGEDAAGSSLVAAAITTDAQGIAMAVVQAGDRYARFRVRASAAFAQPVSFYVAVTTDDWASLVATPRYVGTRVPADTASVEVRLYRELYCADLDREAPPETIYPLRASPTFGEPAAFQLVDANRRHALLATVVTADDRLLAAGCVELLPPQLPARVTVRLELPVEDARARLADAYLVLSALDLRPLGAEVLARAPAWQTAACPLGGASLVLDAALDVLGPEDASAKLLAAERGVPDAHGCRPALLDGGGPSLEARVQVAIEASPTSPGANLPLIASELAHLLDNLLITSTLAPEGTVVSHRLERLSLTSSLDAYTEDAVASLRPVVEATAPQSFNDVTLTIGAHAFTARLGWLLEAALASAVLLPSGIDAPPDRLGTALVEGAASGPATGCAAVSQVACAAVGLDASCLTAACEAGTPSLDAALGLPVALLDVAEVDLRLQGAANAVDGNIDLVAHQLVDGLWSAEVPLSDGAVVAVTGTFHAEP